MSVLYGEEVTLNRAAEESRVAAHFARRGTAMRHMPVRADWKAGGFRL